MKDKIIEWKQELVDIEEFGIKEKEFTKVFNSEPIYTL